MSETRPEDFRRDREWPCPIEGCGASLHSSEQMQLHYQNCHTTEEKEAAWAKVPAFWESKRQVFGLVRVGEKSSESWTFTREDIPHYPSEPISVIETEFRRTKLRDGVVFAADMIPIKLEER